MRPLFDLGQDWTGKGASLRDELEAVQRQTGVTPERLLVPPIPHAFERAMRIWQKLHRRRQTAMGLGNITYPDLVGYTVVNSDPISPGDEEVISVIDEEFFASRAAAEERRSKKAEARPKPIRK